MPVVVAGQETRGAAVGVFPAAGWRAAEQSTGGVREKEARAGGCSPRCWWCRVGGLAALGLPGGKRRRRAVMNCERYGERRARRGLGRLAALRGVPPAGAGGWWGVPTCQLSDLPTCRLFDLLGSRRVGVQGGGVGGLPGGKEGMDKESGCGCERREGATRGRRVRDAETTRRGREGGGV